MLKEDIGQKVKSKFGFTSNTDKDKNNMSVGGIGQRNAEEQKISGSMNKDYALERAKAAHQAYMGKNDKVEPKLEDDKGGSGGTA